MPKNFSNIPEYDLQTPNLIYASDKIKKVMELAKKVANDPGCRIITIIGEPGVMKSELARWISNKCNKKGKTVEINCGLLTETLIEAELYGRIRGAYTNSEETKNGLVEKAHQGVCIFDDINFIPVNHQNKLAYFIEHGRFKQVGCNTFSAVDVKIIATTNIPWESAVRDNQIQKDLYNRLNNFRIQIPPLRDRKEDILILAKYFLEQKIGKMKIGDFKFSPKVKKCFVNYIWPGNVRELKQTVEGSITRCDKNIILLKHLPEDVVKGSNTENQSNLLQDELQDNSTLFLDSELKKLFSFVISRDDPKFYRRDYENYREISKSKANRVLNSMVERGILTKNEQGRATHYTVSPRKLIELSKQI